MFTRATILVLLVSLSMTAFARNEESVDQLIARAESAPQGERPALYMRIARRQAEVADKLYQEGNTEAAGSALAKVVTYSDKASDISARTGKKMKDTEIALRKIAERFRDLKRSLPFEDQAPVQQAIDRLEKMRTDLLSTMFGKKGSS